MKNFIQNVLEGKTLNLSEVARETGCKVARFKVVYYTVPLLPRDRVGDNETTVYFGTQAEVLAFAAETFPNGTNPPYRGYKVTEVDGISRWSSDYKGDYRKLVLESLEDFRQLLFDAVVEEVAVLIGCQYPIDSISIKFDTDVTAAVEKHPDTEPQSEPQQKDRSGLFFVEFIRNSRFVPSDENGCFFFDSENERDEALLELNEMYAEYDSRTSFRNDDLWLEIFAFPRDIV